MSTLPALTDADVPPQAKASLEGVHAAFGVTPNLFRVAANSPAALEGLVALNGALAKGALRARARASLALTVAQANGCDYCLSAHTALGKGAQLSDDDMIRARDAEATDAHVAAILQLARAIVRERGQISDAEIAEARAAGVTDAELTEIVAHVALNVFTNYLNIIAGTPIDFPVVRAAELVG